MFDRVLNTPLTLGRKSLQKQPPETFFKKRCSGETLAPVFPFEFFEILYNTSGQLLLALWRHANGLKFFSFWWRLFSNSNNHCLFRYLELDINRDAFYQIKNYLAYLEWVKMAAVFLHLVKITNINYWIITKRSN